VILSGWKEIAKYLHCSVRTAQRWQALGLPTHRPRGEIERGTVTAFSDSLDVWLTTIRGCDPAMNTHSTGRELLMDGAVLSDMMRRMEEAICSSHSEAQKAVFAQALNTLRRFKELTERSRPIAAHSRPTIFPSSPA
jgi:hypothetical protein